MPGGPMPGIIPTPIIIGEGPIPATPPGAPPIGPGFARLRDAPGGGGGGLGGAGTGDAAAPRGAAPAAPSALPGSPPAPPCPCAASWGGSSSGLKHSSTSLPCERRQQQDDLEVTQTQRRGRPPADAHLGEGDDEVGVVHLPRWARLPLLAPVAVGAHQHLLHGQPRGVHHT